LIYRGALTLVTLFWVIMNIALWRAEYGGHGPLGSAVPADLVWKKILTAPDSSSLSVFHHGTKIGFCHWQTSVGEELSRVKDADDPTEGMVKRVSGYKLQLEANLALDHASRLRFDSWLTMDSQRSWQELNCRLTLRPLSWELHSVAAEQTVTLKTGEGQASTANSNSRTSAIPRPSRRSLVRSRWRPSWQASTSALPARRSFPPPIGRLAAIQFASAILRCEPIASKPGSSIVMTS
jgi:hypothetical protein